MGSTHTHQHTHEAVKTDAQVDAEKEIEKEKTQVKKEIETKQLEFAQIEAEKDNDLRRRLTEQRASIDQEHTRKMNELQEKVQEERIAALERKKSLLEPTNLQKEVEGQTLAQWNGFGPVGSSAVMKSSEQKTGALTYAELSDPDRIASHVEELFVGVPDRARVEFKMMASNAMGIVKDSQAKVTEITQSSRKECGFNVKLDNGEEIHCAWRYALAFRYNTVTEDKAKQAGFLTWFQEQLSAEKQHDLTTVAISYKCDVHTGVAKPGALTLGQSSEFEKLGLG